MSKTNDAIYEFVKKSPNKYTVGDIADAFKKHGVSPDGVRNLIKRNPDLKVLSHYDTQQEVEMPRKTKAEISAEAKLEAKLRAESRKRREVERKYRITQDDLALVERERDAMLAVKKSRKHHKVKSRRKKGEDVATAVAILSDTHYEEEVKESMVQGRNKYNLDIAKHRNDEFFEKVVRLIRKERQDVRIDGLVLGLLGDLITGDIHEDVSMDACLLGPIDASIFAQDLIKAGIRFIREQEPDLPIRVVCKFGNHARTTKRIHINDEGAYSTEKMIYSHLAHSFEDDDKVTFFIEDAYHTYMEIAGFLVRFHHGHHVKYYGGVGGLTIPLNKAIAGWNTRRNYADLDVVGHFHQYMCNHYDRFLVNGSLIGYNTYAVSIKAKFQPPMQSFFLLDHDKGLTVPLPILFTK